MDNLVFELPLIPIASALHTTLDGATAIGPLGMPSFFCNWGLLGAVIPVLGALAALLHNTWKEDPDVRNAVLSLEQVASAYFVQAILEEARRVFVVIDSHLPFALSQEGDPNAKPSRFDYLCQSLRRMSDADLDNRAKYANFLKECMSGVIFDCGKRILDGIRSSGGSNRVLNPTMARFGLEEDAFHSFSTVAEFHHVNRQLEARQYFFLRATGWLSLIGCIAGVACSSGIILSNDSVQLISQYSFLAMIGLAGLAFILLGAARLAKDSLLRRGRRFGDPAAVKTFVEAKKAENGTKDH